MAFFVYGYLKIEMGKTLRQMGQDSSALRSKLFSTSAKCPDSSDPPNWGLTNTCQDTGTELLGQQCQDVWHQATVIKLDGYSHLHIHECSSRT